jgi:diguanylate cyclase (GGDEF)-like protein
MSQNPPSRCAPSIAAPLDLLIEMTCTRERVMIDSALLAALSDTDGVQEVRLWRLIGEADGPRFWILCGIQRAGREPPIVADQLPDDERDPLVLSSLPSHWHCFERAEVTTTVQGDRHLLLLPMAGDLHTAGVLEVCSSRPVSDSVRTLLACVLRVHGNYMSLLDYSERDTLTGLLNRKSFDSTFLQATVVDAHRLYSAHDVAATATTVPERRQDGPRRYWLGVIDIDHFKQINDRFGHLVGDEALTVLARLMRSTFRYDDRLYRFGGEEFVVLLSAPDEDSARAAFERFRHAVESHYFIGIGRSTVSIGFSDVRAGDTPQACFDRADKAVYYGKTHGRNQVCSQLALVAAGELEDNMKFGSVELF